jgi:hypothetical protein
MTPYFESVIGFDPDGICRIYASTWIEARQEARNYIRNRPGTGATKRMALHESSCQRHGGSFWVCLTFDLPLKTGLGFRVYVTTSIFHR